MPVDLARLRVERFQVEVSYHATWTFDGLKGILGETWAHGPIFGFFSDAITGQVNLTPATTAEDTRITAVAGLRASGLLAEGPKWTSQAPQISQDWLQDVFELLKPQRTVGMKIEIFGIFPIRNPDVATTRLRDKYYNDAEFSRLVGPAERATYTAIDVFAPPTSDEPASSYVVGVVGPPHRGTFFTHEDKDRDSAWWMGVRLNQLFAEEDGIEAPLDKVKSMISGAEKEFRRIVTVTLPTLVE